jgi:hypothetical protein
MIFGGRWSLLSGNRHGRHLEVSSHFCGIKNASIRDALVDLLGKPIAESANLPRVAAL